MTTVEFPEVSDQSGLTREIARFRGPAEASVVSDEVTATVSKITAVDKNLICLEPHVPQTSPMPKILDRFVLLQAGELQPRFLTLKLVPLGL